MKRTRGTGSLFKRGTIWWFSFVRDGLLVRESAYTARKSEAAAKLERRIRECEQGFTNEPESVAALMESVWSDYLRKGRRSLDDAKTRWSLHLEPVFGKMSARAVTTRVLEDYVKGRREEGASKATVNRELSLLRRAFHLGAEATPRRVHMVPKFPTFTEDNARQGFLADDKQAALAAACAKRGLWFRAMFETGVQLGWRVGELQSLRVRQVSLADKTLRLEPGTTKNDEGRTAVMPSVLFELIRQCVAAKAPDDYLFTRDGAPVLNFRKAWAAATAEAGVPDLLFHDLRRTAVRNMVRRGIPERVAMEISGHKTRSIFDRYHIVATADLQDAARRMDVELKPTIDTQEVPDNETKRLN